MLVGSGFRVAKVGRLVDEILIETSPAETRAALLEGGVVEGNDEPFGPRVGDIVRQARVTDVDGPRAWVDLGGLTGMLMSAKGRRPDVGDLLLCQVQGEPGGDKTVAVTAAIEIPGRYVVLTPLVPGAAVSRKISPPARRKALRAEVEAALSVGTTPALTRR